MEFTEYNYELSLAQNVKNLAIDFKSKHLDQNLEYAVEFLGKQNEFTDRDIFNAAKSLMEDLLVDETLLRDARNSQHTRTVGRMLKDYL